MAKIYLSDKQLPTIPSEGTLDALLELTKKATPGLRAIKDLPKDAEGRDRFQLVSAMSEGPLGRADGELAAACTPELVRGMLYKLALLEDAKTEACNLLQDALGAKMTPQQAAKLKKLVLAGQGALSDA